MMERFPNASIVRGNIDRHDGSDATGSAANVRCAWSLRYLRFYATSIAIFVDFDEILSDVRKFSRKC